MNAMLMKKSSSGKIRHLLRLTAASLQSLGSTRKKGFRYGALVLLLTCGFLFAMDGAGLARTNTDGRGIPPAADGFDHPNHSSDGQYSETFNINVPMTLQDIPAVALPALVNPKSCDTNNPVQIVIDKSVVPTDGACNQWDVALTIKGNPPPRPIDAILVIDRSGSMDSSSDTSYPYAGSTPMAYAKNAAYRFAQKLLTSDNPTGLNRVGVVSYATTASLNQALTGTFSSVASAIGGLTGMGSTNIEQGFTLADNEMQNSAAYDCDRIRVIVLLTDGVANHYNNPPVSTGCGSLTTSTNMCAREAIQAGVDAQNEDGVPGSGDTIVYGIGWFDLLDASTRPLAANTMIGAVTTPGDEPGNHYFEAKGAANLDVIYNQILIDILFAAKKIPFSTGLVTDTLNRPPFNLIPGSLIAGKGTANESPTGVINWDVGQVNEETILLRY